MQPPVRSLSALLVTLALAGCGGFPQPFAGNPGATAMRLARPAALRLTVPAPDGALLGGQGAAFWSIETARALAAEEVPAVATTTQRGDWALRLQAHLVGNTVLPSYVVLDAQGKSLGSVDAEAVPAEAWAMGDPAMIRRTAETAAPRIATMLTAIQAALRQSDPNSLLNRPARIWFTGVTGAPGDGDRTLAQQMRIKLPDNGDLVQDTIGNADFTLKGRVTLTPEPGHQQQVEIHWIVTEASTGKVAGEVAQGHDIEAGSLDQYWGEIAAVVAGEAASGVHDVISNWSGRHKSHPPPAA